MKLSFVSILIAVSFAVYFTNPISAKTAITNGEAPYAFIFWSPESASPQYEDIAPSRENRANKDNMDLTAYYENRRTGVHFRTNGDVLETKYLKRYFPSQVSIRNYGNINLRVDAFSQELTIQQAYTVSPNGEKTDVEYGAIQVTAEAEDDIFSDSFNVTIPYGGLEPGAVVILKTEKLTKRKSLALPWSRTYYPQYTLPREKYELTLTWDDGVPPPIWKSDFEALSCQLKTERQIICVAKDIPAYKSDPDIKYVDVLPTLVVTKTKTWREIVQKYENLFQRQLSNSPEIHHALDKILKAGGTKKERLNQIHKFVSQKIRYLGIEKGLGGVIPRPTALTLKRKFGDCKDKTALFVDLARNAGFNAYPVLTSTVRRSTEKLILPASHYFDHMVACVRLNNGEEQCVDLTDPYSHFEQSSYSLDGAIRLDIVDGNDGVGTFKRAPHYRVKSVTTSNTFDVEGNLLEEQTVHYAGPLAARIRGYAITRTPQERQSSETDDYQRYYSGSANPQFEFSGIENVLDPVIIRSTVQYNNTFETTGVTSYSERDGWLEKELSTAKSKNKHHDYNFPGTLYHSEYVNKLPFGYIVNFTGPKLNLRTKFGSLTRHYEIKDNIFRVISDLNLPSAQISIDDLPKFNNFLRHLRENANIWVVFKPAENQKN